MGKISRASKLDLSNRNLTEIPDFVFKCRNLKRLILSNNNIREIPLELIGLKYLKSLDLSGNQITQIFAKTFDLTSLQVLNLNNNKIKTLPRQINRLTRLKELHMGGNQLEQLPTEFSELSKLTTLNIGKNLFNSFPTQILALKGLKKLWVGKNYIESLPIREINESLPNLEAFYTFTEKMTVSNAGSSTHLLLKQRGNVVNDLNLIAFNSDRESNLTATNLRVDALPRNIFISYSHKDLPFHEEVEVSIKGLQNAFPDLAIDSWSDVRLKTGQKWMEEIQNAIDKAGIAILITSRNFLASDFIMKSEVPNILSNAKSKGTVIMNLIAGKCIAHPQLKDFQYVNPPDKPLNSLTTHQQDVIYAKLQEDIKQHFEAK